MRRETPEPKEAISFETYEKRIKPIRDLLMAESAGRWAVQAQTRVDLLGKKYKEYFMDQNQLKDFPEFSAFIVELNDLTASGVSGPEISKYSSLYERVLKRVKELQEQIGAIIKSDPDAYWVAAELAAAKDQGEEKIREVIAKHLEEKNKHEASMANLHEFLNLARPAENAFDGMEAQARLKREAEEQKKRGFASVEDMWAHDLSELGKFRKKVGDEEFADLSRNSHRGLSWQLENFEKEKGG